MKRNEDEFNLVQLEAVALSLNELIFRMKKATTLLK
jgi:hypothetical protein